MKLIKDFFRLNLNDYEGFEIAFPIGAFIFAVAVATVAAVFAMTYYKRTNTALYKQLLRHGAIEEEKAKTLKELRLLDSRAVKSALSRSGQLTHIVKRAGETPLTYEEYVASAKKGGYKTQKIDFETAKFYIAPDKTDVAKKTVYGANHAWWKPVAISVGIIAVLVLLMIFLPDVLAKISKSMD